MLMNMAEWRDALESLVEAVKPPGTIWPSEWCRLCPGGPAVLAAEGGVHVSFCAQSRGAKDVNRRIWGLFGKLGDSAWSCEPNALWKGPEPWKASP